MALLTPLSDADAARVAEEFGIDVSAVEPLAAGSVNSNFHLRLADGGALFARIYEEQGEAGARAELELLAQLSAAGVPVALPLRRRDGELLSQVAGKPLSLYPWVPGEILCQARVTVDHARRVGEALAKVHAAPVARVPDGRFDAGALHARVRRIVADAPEFAEVAQELGARLAEHVAAREPELPAGLIHGDLFRDNVLWQEGAVSALLDFESASRGVYAYDLSVCLHAWCFGDRFEPALLRGMVEGYESVRPLSAAERRGLPTEAAIAALRFAITRITDYSLRAPAGQPPVRDYRRFLSRLSAVNDGLFDEL